MFSQHFRVESDQVLLLAEKPQISFSIPGIEWTAAIETALKNGGEAPGLYDISPTSLRDRSYGPYHKHMEASDAGNMAAALRRSQQTDAKINFPLELIDQLEDWAKSNQEILLTTKIE